MRFLPLPATLSLALWCVLASPLPAEGPGPGTPIDNSGLPPAPRVLETPPTPAPTIIPAPDPAHGALDPEEIQGLIGIADEMEFSQKLDGQKAAGRLTDQTIYEIRLLRAWQSENIPLLKELATPAKMAELKYEVGKSTFFTSAAQVASFLELMQGLIAAREGDEARLKAHAIEALWLFPEHANMVGDLITEYQRQKAMANLTVPMTLKLANSAGGESVALADLAKDKKGLLLYFWASWAAPSVQQLPAMVQLAERLLPLGVATAGINTENAPAKAEEARAQQGITFPWLLEPENTPLILLLKIDAVPRTVLLSPEGKVLFIGDPEDARLQDSLRKIGAGL